jgi:uncharacterized membrane protein
MLTFCNSHPVRIWTAISFFSPEDCSGDGQEWQNIWWHLVEPGSCVVVYRNDLADLNRYWYIYAEADDGKEWEGAFPTLVKDEAFNICDGHGATHQTRSVSFRELDVGDDDDHTATFTT